ncbi:MAG TPA: hypothetical protein VGK19_18190 [Capsulimonadaceae bacterium]|jgi:hypothetical protein
MSNAADVDAKMNDGSTALSMAKRTNQANIVTILMAAEVEVA